MTDGRRAGVLPLLFACLVFLAGAAPAAAQAVPQPVETIQPDRPDLTNSTHVVGVGLLQVEFGGVYTFDGPGQRAFGSPFTARLGLFKWLEVRVGGDGLLVHADAGTRDTGFGNIQLGAKLRLWDSPGGTPLLAILPSVNVPTADAHKGLGSGDTDYTIALLTGADIGARGHIDFNYGLGSTGAGGGAPHFVQHLASISASVAVTHAWSPYAEVFCLSRQDPGGSPAASIDAGATYTVGPRWALDGGFQVGLSDAAPNVGVFAGFSIIVGDVFGRHDVRGHQRPLPTLGHTPRSHD